MGMSRRRRRRITLFGFEVLGIALGRLLHLMREAISHAQLTIRETIKRRRRSIACST
jgi:hypothetical protein